LVPAALEGFRSLADADHRALRDLNDTDVVDAYFDGALGNDVQWHNHAAKRYWAADLRDALRAYDGYARNNAAWGGEWDIDVAKVRQPTWLLV
jgi:hypothetical protein